MQRTQNYNLCQWEAEDRIMRSDFNADNQKIDAALAEKARIATGTYTGTGEYGAGNPNTLTFDFVPKVLFMTSCYTNREGTVGWLNGQYRCIIENDANAKTVFVTWDGRTVSWYTTENNAMYQFNESGRTYQYIAIG